MKSGKFKTIQNFEKMCENSEHFKRSFEDYKKGRVNTTRGVKAVWVSQVVKVREWNNYYKYNRVYFYLEKVLDGVKIAFLTTEPVPESCELLNDEELRILDDYRRSNYIYPTPLKKVEL